MKRILQEDKDTFEKLFRRKVKINWMDFVLRVSYNHYDIYIIEWIIYIFIIYKLTEKCKILNDNT